MSSPNFLLESEGVVYVSFFLSIAIAPNGRYKFMACERCARLIKV